MSLAIASLTHDGVCGAFSGCTTAGPVSISTASGARVLAFSFALALAFQCIQAVVCFLRRRRRSDREGGLFLITRARTVLGIFEIGDVHRGTATGLGHYNLGWVEEVVPLPDLLHGIVVLRVFFSVTDSNQFETSRWINYLPQQFPQSILIGLLSSVALVLGGRILQLLDESHNLLEVLTSDLPAVLVEHQLAQVQVHHEDGVARGLVDLLEDQPHHLPAIVVGHVLDMFKHVLVQLAQQVVVHEPRGRGELPIRSGYNRAIGVGVALRYDLVEGLCVHRLDREPQLLHKNVDAQHAKDALELTFRRHDPLPELEDVELVWHLRHRAVLDPKLVLPVRRAR